MPSERFVRGAVERGIPSPKWPANRANHNGNARRNGSGEYTPA